MIISDIESATPALCRLQLGNELRQLRLVAGLKSGQVSKRLLWSPSKLTRLETGENSVVEPADVIALCEMYGATPETRENLKGYAAVTKTKRDWWQSAEYRPTIRPGFKALLGQEAIASSMHNYECEFVPGLLQAESYIRAIYERGHTGPDADEADRQVNVRMTRREVLLRADRPLKLVAIFSEAILWRRVGSRDVMREQLNHIMEMSALPNVRVQVVPFVAGVHPGMSGPFLIMRFRDPMLKPVVYLENMANAWVTRREEDCERYSEAFTDLQAMSPGPRESLEMITKAIKEI